MDTVRKHVCVPRKYAKYYLKQLVKMREIENWRTNLTINE